jgi:hypothetical protein
VVSVGGGGFIVTKGNKTTTSWQIVVTQSKQDGLLDGVMRDASGVMRVSPNPLRAGFATVVFGARSELLDNSVMSLRIHDATGRLVLHSSLGIRNSSFPLDLRSLPPGVYMVRLTADSYSATQKLIVQE